MKVKAKLEEVSIDYRTGKQILSFLVLDNINTLEELETVAELDLEVKKHREKRTLDANRLCLGSIRKITRKIKYTKRRNI